MRRSACASTTPRCPDPRADAAPDVPYARAVDDLHRTGAEALSSLLARSTVPPEAFRAALLAVPPNDRDAWLDVVLGLVEVPDDGPELPRGCVPYLPCPVDAVLRAVDLTSMGAHDLFVDVGAGVGRAAALAGLLSGAASVGLEIQPALVREARSLGGRLPHLHFTPIEGDAVRLSAPASNGTVFFLYCPFGGERLVALLGALEHVARMRPIHVCCVDLPLPPCPWLSLVAPAAGDLAVYRSTPPPVPAW